MADTKIDLNSSIESMVIIALGRTPGTVPGRMAYQKWLQSKLAETLMHESPVATINTATT